MAKKKSKKRKTNYVYKYVFFLWSDDDGEFITVIARNLKKTKSLRKFAKKVAKRRNWPCWSVRVYQNPLGYPIMHNYRQVWTMINEISNIYKVA